MRVVTFCTLSFLLMQSPLLLAAEVVSPAVSGEDKAVSAAGVPIPSAVMEALKRLVKVDFDKVKVAPAPISGLYEAVIATEVVYVSADGKHLFVGDIRDLAADGENLTDKRRAELRRAELAALQESEMIVFAPKGDTRFTVNIFTDVDCPYCTKIHEEVAALNEAGVKVRYLAYPRAGEGSDTFRKMVSVWCAKDPHQALTDAKLGKDVPAAECKNPVMDQFALGRRIGVTGTPAIVLESGEIVGGYMPANRLIAYLNSH